MKGFYKNIYIAVFALLSILGFIFFGCDNALLETIEKDIAVPEEAPLITVNQDTTLIENESGIFDFLGVIVDGDGGASSVDTEFTIYNTGSIELEIISVSLASGDTTSFDLTDTTASPVPIASPFNSTSFSISFDPLSLGAKEATVEIVNNDDDRNPYTFTVKGNGTNLEAPSDVDATDALHTGFIRITWTDPNASGVTGYKIYRSDSESGTYSYNGTSATASYDDTDIPAPWTNYYYKITAYNAVGESGLSDPDEGCTNDGAIYVRSDGNDTNIGSPDSPKLIIQTAIDLADSLFTTGEVRVAQGSYIYPGQIDMKEGISLYGGYNSAFSTRNPDVYTTSIANTKVGGNAYTVYAGSGITSATCIDGFRISGSGSSVDNSYTLYLNGSSPSIENNILYAGDGTSKGCAIYITGPSSPVIQYNTIHGGGGPTNISYGMYCYNSTPTFQYNIIDGGTAGANCAMYYDSCPACTINNSTIHGGTDSTTSCGIHSYNSSITIHNNVIDGGFSTGISYAIRLQSGGASMYNNTITTGGGSGTGYGIHINNCFPKIRNNIIFGN